MRRGEGLQKILNIVYGCFILAIILFIIIYINYNSISTLGILPNLIDFISNIIIAFGSAGIAWIVSDKQISKEKEERKHQEYTVNKNNYQMVLMELETNKKILEVSKELINVSILEKSLSHSIWEQLGYSLKIDISKFKEVNGLYTRIAIIKHMETFETESVDKLINSIDRYIADNPSIE